MPIPFLSIPENPAPANAEAFDVVTGDKVVLRAGRFKAPSDRPFKGTVCLFQGRGEFIEKYFEVIGELNERGFSVAALDWRGQGGSQRLLKDPKRGHIRRFDDFQRDVLAFMEDFVRPETPRRQPGVSGADTDRPRPARARAFPAPPHSAATAPTA